MIFTHGHCRNSYKYSTNDNTLAIKELIKFGGLRNSGYFSVVRHFRRTCKF